VQEPTATACVLYPEVFEIGADFRLWGYSGKDLRRRLEGDIFAMNWTDRKGPPVSQPRRRGPGSTVVDPMIAAKSGDAIEAGPCGIA
jgi:hypothetical protein